MLGICCGYGISSKCDVSSSISVWLISLNFFYELYILVLSYLDSFRSSIMPDIWLSISSELFMMSSTLSFVSDVSCSPSLSSMVS